MHSELDMTIKEKFRHLAHETAQKMGTAAAFGMALASILIWLVCGPIFHFSDTWQLVINTATTIVTFLMVFLIQNAQNRDAKAIHLKLDELIRAIEPARNKLMDLENLSDEELEALHLEFKELQTEVDCRLKKREIREPKLDAQK